MTEKATHVARAGRRSRSPLRRAAGDPTLRIMKTAKLPGPDHPITIAPAKAHVVVRAGGKVIADTREALALKEATYAVVYYVPIKDVDMKLLERTDHHTYCPYKGDASYYSISAGGENSINAVWRYEAPYPAVDAIAEHVAFYPQRVDTIEVT
jgi:uncharacterized protein (DUF427 family)